MGKNFGETLKSRKPGSHENEIEFLGKQISRETRFRETRDFSENRIFRKIGSRPKITKNFQDAANRTYIVVRVPLIHKTRQL